MKTLRKMTAAALLACALTVSASAGEMHAPGAPPPPQPAGAGSIVLDEDSGTVLNVEQTTAATMIATLLNSVLSVL